MSRIAVATPAKASPAAQRSAAIDLAARGVEATRGRPLEPSTRTFMDARFRHDFGAVRVHADGGSARAAAALGARAYALGDHVVFAPGQYVPDTPRGRWVLAHELSHVVQRRPGGARADGAVEPDARRAATDALAGRPVQVAAHHDGTEPHWFGEPENVPDLTYVATSGAQQYLRQAAEFHEAWGLAPKRVGSLQAVVDDLAGGTGELSRVRIVTHAVDRGVLMPLFTGEGKATTLTTERLSAHAESEEAGLGAESELNLGATAVDEIVADVRTNNAAALRPFGLDQSGLPTGALEKFFRRVIMLEWLTMMRTKKNAAQVDLFIGATQKLLPLLRTAVVTQFAPAAPAAGTAATGGAPPAATTPPAVTATQVNDLEGEVAASASAIRSVFIFNKDAVSRLEAATKAGGGGFRDRLTTVRKRFSDKSWIDIRGCNAGDSLDYLRAVASFFGRADAPPHVSAPDWFEVFPILGSRPVRDDKAIARLAGNAKVQEALDRWAPLTGVRAQMASLRLFYQSEILRRELLDATRQPPRVDLAAGTMGPIMPPFAQTKLSPLLGGLPTPSADEIAVMLLMDPIMPALAQPGPLFPQRSGPSLFPGGIEDPGIGIARRALARLDRPNAELFYYLQSGVLLPVFVGPSPQAVYFYYLESLGSEAMAHWLASQWATEAPGLEHIAKQRVADADPRRVQGLVERRPGEASPPDSRILFPPDPEYWTHIKSV
jgi:hypothetical protein